MPVESATDFVNAVAQQINEMYKAPGMRKEEQRAAPLLSATVEMPNEVKKINEILKRVDPDPTHKENTQYFLGGKVEGLTEGRAVELAKQILAILQDSKKIEQKKQNTLFVPSQQSTYQASFNKVLELRDNYKEAIAPKIRGELPKMN